MMTPSFSLIIPAFNVESLIGRALDSILCEGSVSFEVIVIDDGSTDGTASIVAGYAAKDNRIRLYCQANAGQGAARSFGLDRAIGSYIWCIDADDWIEAGALRRMKGIFDQTAPDVVVAGFACAFGDGRVMPSRRLPTRLTGHLIDPKQDEETFSALSCWSAPPWRLVCRRALIESGKIRFPHRLFYEDHPFAIEVMALAKSVHIDDVVSYYYLQRPGSTVHVNDRKVFDILPIRRRCLELLRIHGFSARFPHIICSYIVPLGFIRHHVPSEHHGAFLARLSADLTVEEREHVNLHGTTAEKKLLAAVIRQSVPLLERLLARLAKPGFLDFLVGMPSRACKFRGRRTWQRVARLLPRSFPWQL